MTGATMSLRPSGIGRYAQAAFLSVWLVGWAVGETFAIGMLATILGWMGGLLSEPRPAWTVNLVASGGVTFALIFLAFWLTGWTIGGIAALTQLMRSLVGTDFVDLTDGGFEVVRRAGPFRRRYSFERSAIRRLRIRPRDHAVVADTARGTRVITTFGLLTERDALAAWLRNHLALPDSDQDAGALPAGWELRSDVDTACLRKVKPRVRIARAVIAWVLAAVMSMTWYQLVQMGSPASSAPALVVALLLTVGAAVATWGRRELIARPGELTFHRSFATWASSRTFRSARLEVTHDTDSDGDSSYKLIVTDAEGRKTIHTEVHDSGEVVDLGRWLAARTGFPLRSFDVLLADRWPPRGSHA